MNFPLHLNIKPPEKSSARLEIFNYKDPESLAAFKKETSNSSKLSDCFKGSELFQNQVAKWKKS